jgi:hypothetical protein
MDPYIEACGFWEDFHHGLVVEIANVLSSKLPENYVARTGVRNYVVIGKPAGEATHELSTALDVVSMRPFIAEQFKEPFVEISVMDEEERRLVTCIEVLSPANKRKGTEGWDSYLRKRQALLLGEASLVEIDLLRGGTRMPMLDPWPKTPYTLLVSRRSHTPGCRVWRAHFQRPLPAIPVPLATYEPDVMLELQPLVETIYARRRYWKCIDYGKALLPPLSAEENAWFEAQMQARAAPT